jgi:hypothetical protein
MTNFGSLAQEKKMIISKILIVFGYIFLLFALHEVYHLHNGVPQGICIGNCQVERLNEPAQMVLIFDKLVITDREQEENNAWAFSIVIIFLIGLIQWRSWYLKGGKRKNE